MINRWTLVLEDSHLAAALLLCSLAKLIRFAITFLEVEILLLFGLPFGIPVAHLLIFNTMLQRVREKTSR